MINQEEAVRIFYFIVAEYLDRFFAVKVISKILNVRLF